jgi:phage gpG-like protein
MADEVDGYDGLETFYVDMGKDFEKTDYEPMLRSFLTDLQVIHEVYFASEIDPSGEAWPRLAESTVARKGHSIVLWETGRLEDSLEGTTGDSIRVVSTGEGSEDFLVFGTSVPYSIFHQEGTGRMPQREHVGISETVLDIFAEKAADAAVKPLAEE